MDGDCTHKITLASAGLANFSRGCSLVVMWGLNSALLNVCCYHSAVSREVHLSCFHCCSFSTKIPKMTANNLQPYLCAVGIALFTKSTADSSHENP